ncbi:MAG TPA: hypothetical protein VMY06_06400 [Sedimentisphaerales bacterium]|nr:hypothetical protein [Sedimentisphaerales bacterium]
MTIESFLEKYAKATVTRVEVFYEPWTMHSPVILTEEHLFGGYSQPMVRIVGRVPYPHFTDMKEPLEKCSYRRIENGPVDLRLGFIFRSVEDEVFRLSLGKIDATPILVVNDELFEATPEVVRAMMRFLPVNAYEKMEKALIDSGFLQNQLDELAGKATQSKDI